MSKLLGFIDSFKPFSEGNYQYSTSVWINPAFVVTAEKAPTTLTGRGAGFLKLTLIDHRTIYVKEIEWATIAETSNAR